MKKIYIMALISFATLLSSCKDFLNMPPKNVRVVYTMEDVRGAASLFLFATTSSNLGNGYYSNIVYFNGKMIAFPYNRFASVLGSMSSDDMDMTRFINPNISSTEKNRGGYQYLKEYDETKEWGSYLFGSRVWNNVFTNVGYLNMILKDLSRVPDYNKTDYERISGEARVFRAYYLLRLNQLFAPYHLNDYGIPYNLDADEYGKIPRKKQTELYRELIKELTDVLSYETEPKISWNLFYNKRIIKAILAQTYMYKAESCAKESDDWKNAERYAREARNNERIENSEVEQAELVNVPNEKIVYRPHHPFCLYRMTLLGDEASGSHNYYAPYGNPATLLQQAPSDDLYALYEDGDIRKNVYFKIQDGRPYFSKYINKGSIDSYNLNVILFRHSEMMLIEAEAMARQGNMDGAKQLLESFKSSKIAGFTTYTGNDILGEIIKERRKEFVLEEQMRWIDMKRLGLGVTRDILNTEDNSISSVTLVPNDYRFALPIPAELELNYNPIAQNPGWKY